MPDVLNIIKNEKQKWTRNLKHKSLNTMFVSQSVPYESAALRDLLNTMIGLNLTFCAWTEYCMCCYSPSISLKCFFFIFQSVDGIRLLLKIVDESYSNNE